MANAPMPTRNREIDFLRGLAIILVLLRHRELNTILYRGGWVGVDLFFVLSGFLIGGLLFAEYKAFGNIKPGLFLIRRGFKIYPSYYLLIAVRVLYLIWYTWDGKMVFKWAHVWNQVFFIQNYYPLIVGPTWSLAVEEHFYILLALLLWMAGKYKLIERGNLFIWFCLSLFAITLALRVLTLHYLPITYFRNIFATHLRLDSLMAGVLLAWLYNYRPESLKNWYFNNCIWAWPLALACIVPPFFLAVDGYYMLSVGFSLHYMGFGFILIGFLLDGRVPVLLNRLLSPYIYKLFWKTGLYSYNIYLWHGIAGSVFLALLLKYFPILKQYHYWQDVLYFAFSFGMGILLTISLENWFLKLRNRYYPSRKAAV